MLPANIIRPVLAVAPYLLADILTTGAVLFHLNVPVSHGPVLIFDF